MIPSFLQRSFLIGVSLVLCGVLHAGASVPAPNPHWEPEIKAMEARDRLKPAGAGADAILFVGSSSIRLWKTLDRDFPGLRVYNHGFGGSHLIDTIAYADRIVFPLKPATIVLYAGTNDINGGTPPETVAEQFKQFVEMVREQLPETRILYIAIAANPSRWHLREKIQQANRLIEEQTRLDERLGFIDAFSAMLGPDGQPLPDIFVEDGLHMNAKGYAIWTELVRPRLP